MGMIRDRKARLPVNKKGNNIVTKLEEYGFKSTSISSNRYLSKGDIILMYRKQKNNNCSSWRYYTDYNKNIYFEFFKQDELLKFIEKTHSKGE